MEDIKKKNMERIAFLEEKTAELVQEQESELVTDYDQALEEYEFKNKPHKIKFNGKVFKIPHTMPFSFSMFYMRHCLIKQGGKTMFTIPDDKLATFIEKMFGADFLNEFDQNNKASLDFLLQIIIPDVMYKWGYNVKSNKPTEKNG